MREKRKKGERNRQRGTEYNKDFKFYATSSSALWVRAVDSSRWATSMKMSNHCCQGSNWSFLRVEINFVAAIKPAKNTLFWASCTLNWHKPLKLKKKKWGNGTEICYKVERFSLNISKTWTLQDFPIPCHKRWVGKVSLKFHTIKSLWSHICPMYKIKKCICWLLGFLEDCLTMSQTPSQ